MSAVKPLPVSVMVQYAYPLVLGTDPFTVAEKVEEDELGLVAVIAFPELVCVCHA